MAYFYARVTRWSRAFHGRTVLHLTVFAQSANVCKGSSAGNKSRYVCVKSMQSVIFSKGFFLPFRFGTLQSFVRTNYRTTFVKKYPGVTCLRGALFFKVFFNNFATINVENLIKYFLENYMRRINILTTDWWSSCRKKNISVYNLSLRFIAFSNRLRIRRRSSIWLFTRLQEGYVHFYAFLYYLIYLFCVWDIWFLQCL